MLKAAAHIVSVLFHPLFILPYMTFFMMWVNPYLFGANSIVELYRLLFLILISLFVLPAFAIFLMRRLELIQNYTMEDRYDRIGPYIATGIFYLWMFMNLKNNPEIPSLYKSFVLGATISLFGAFFINLFSKISLHAVGMGGFLLMMLLVIYSSYDNLTPYLLVTIFIVGLVGSSRLLLKAHSPQDIYGGYMIGIVGQSLAFQLMV